ncbi:SepM family pheromone-processing serine protease [Pontibacillus litoralis]|uniref:endopeptidase La n=1 Tax=Pontibacillus litoralis JSM 072002 TaxID=1385512 RepID=A0A0A5G967_9BACI|nr:SepM family pheromone-processing serine protease [Pontibacillus litoralis]KGX88559.1 hypothetical protein N784_07770 [Pontibacillus litoralis JSM 072002]
MNQNKRYLIFGIVVALLVFFLSFYRLPYYIYKPGSADALNPIVQVDNGYESEGDMHLVTIRGGQASIVQYAVAKLMPYQTIYPKKDVIPESISDNEYMHMQLQMMESSQEKSKVVAYEAANKDITITYDGVYVMSVEDSAPANDVLKVGDRIIQVDDQPIKKSEDLLNYVEGKKVGDAVEITFERKDETKTESVQMVKHPNENRAIIGITLVTDRNVDVDPGIEFTSGEIGGPSAGLMFSLEIYDQLTEEDLTKGKEIAGTGEISYEGNVGPIGGIDQKVVAADKEGADIFFAPNEGGKQGSNYNIAEQTAKDIETDMKIVPVDTFEEAVTYLEQLESN